jgi:site-specific recombinase XerD
MFEQICKHPAALARHRAAPLLQERQDYLTHLAAEGMRTRCLQQVASYLLVVIEYLHLANRDGEAIETEEIERESVRWAKRRANKCRRRRGGQASGKVFRCYATNWLKFLGRLKQQTDTSCPYAVLINGFADYMGNERGWSPVTIRDRCRFIQRYLDQLDEEGIALDEVTVERIDAMFLKMLGALNYSPTAVRTYASHLRTFFDYAALHGWCPSGLAEAIRGPRIFRCASLAEGPSWENVQRLLASTEGDEPMDIRDHAILMLLAVYGLRAGEVSHLQLEDFDWHRELLFVTCFKSRQRRTYPLCNSVGSAVLRYIKEVRPISRHQDVFLSMRAPIQPVRELWAMVARRWRRLGISLPHFGPHALRHACATHLLSQGHSLKEIGDHLGHHNSASTRIYAKVDLLGLRCVADFDLGGVL